MGVAFWLMGAALRAGAAEVGGRAGGRDDRAGRFSAVRSATGDLAQLHGALDRDPAPAT